MYVLVNRAVPDENGRFVDDPFLRGRLGVRETNSERLTSFFELEPHSSKYDLNIESTGRSRNTGFGRLNVDFNENRVDFNAWTTSTTIPPLPPHELS